MTSIPLRVPVRLLVGASWIPATALVLAVAAGASSATPLRGASAGAPQLPAQAAGMTMGQARALVRQSNLSPSALRRQALAQGVDPALLTELLGSSGAPLSSALADNVLVSQELLDALVAAGLIVGVQETRDMADPPTETGDLADGAEEEATERVSAAVAELGADLEIFGSRVFRSARRDPVRTTPPGDTYVLGPGDRIFLHLTGDVEQAYSLVVTREGVVYLPRAGQVAASGLTLAEFEDRMEGRLRTVYSGVGRDAGSTTRFSVSLGRVRSIQIYVSGAVYSPGSHVVSSLASLVDAMYVANGPTPDGSYRHVRLVRGDEELEVDLYPYITTGRPGANPTLREGDVVHVPWVGGQVAIRGMIRNPGIYEMREGQGIEELIDFAGGLLPSARTDFAAVNRILPPEDRRPMTARVRLDAPLGRVLAGEESFLLQAGDRVEIRRVNDFVRREVLIQGAVAGEGMYEWEPGLTIMDMLDKAGGPNPDALLSEVLVARKDLTSGAVSRLRVDLASEDAPLAEEGDEITVFSKAILRSVDSVSVHGLVRVPGPYLFVDGMTAGDLILQAGGFVRGANPWMAEISRRLEGTGDYSSETVFSPVRPSVARISRDAALVAPPGDTIAELPLRPGDELFVRSRIGYDELASVVLQGEFHRNGMYVLQSRDERMTSLVMRAGGLRSPELNDIELRRGAVAVAVNYDQARRAPGSLADPILQDGDTLIAPQAPSTVLIEGGVVFPTEVAYAPGLSVGDVLSSAGGAVHNADRDRLSVSYPDGSRATTHKSLWLFRSDPPLRAGARVFVPLREEEVGGFDWGQASSVLLAVASTTATLIVAFNSGG